MRVCVSSVDLFIFSIVCYGFIGFVCFGFCGWSPRQGKGSGAELHPSLYFFFCFSLFQTKLVYIAHVDLELRILLPQPPKMKLQVCATTPSLQWLLFLVFVVGQLDTN